MTTCIEIKSLQNLHKAVNRRKPFSSKMVIGVTLERYAVLMVFLAVMEERYSDPEFLSLDSEFKGYITGFVRAIEEEALKLFRQIEMEDGIPQTEEECRLLLERQKAQQKRRR